VRQRSLHELYLVAVAAVVQLAVGTALRLVPVRTVWRLIAKSRTLARWIAKAPEARIAWAIEAAGRRLPWISTCLVRALAAELFLGNSRNGHIRIGVRRSAAGTLESHAWFERDGRTIVGGSPVAYVDFMTLDAGPADRP